jgi:hypothetical protein
LSIYFSKITYEDGHCIKQINLSDFCKLCTLRYPISIYWLKTFTKTETFIFHHLQWDWIHFWFYLLFSRLRLTRICGFVQIRIYSIPFSFWNYFLSNRIAVLPAQALLRGVTCVFPNVLLIFCGLDSALFIWMVGELLRNNFKH